MQGMQSKIVLAAALLALAGGVNAADVKRGQKLFEECAACHTHERGAQNGVGPNLFGVVGRKAGEVDEFRYSPAMKRSGIVWSEQDLDAYIADPQAKVPANRMPFSGMPDARDRADLLAYLLSALK
jgi:cytochrome c